MRLRKHRPRCTRKPRRAGYLHSQEAMAGISSQATGRERVLDAAYDLFSQNGVSGVGVDAVIAEAGVAKATLYSNFASKEDLAIAFLEKREERWTNGWVRDEVYRRETEPRKRLLAIFDIFNE